MKIKYSTLALSAVFVLSPIAALYAASLIDLGYGSSSQVGIDAGAINVDRTVLQATTSESGSAGVDVDFSSSVSSQVGADAVATDGDLESYTSSAMQSDESINAINFASDKVTVNYKDKGRFIGLIPVTLSVDVTIDKDGNVSVDYPWYAFLVTKDKADIESRVNAEVAGDASATAGSGWTNLDRARLAGHILTALRAHYNASASSTDSTSAGY